jgi:hypothetical protein
VGSFPLLSQAPTPVEVELGCDKIIVDIIGMTIVLNKLGLSCAG